MASTERTLLPPYPPLFAIANPPSLPRDAWAAQHGLSRTAAKRHYISTLIATMHTYASATPDARALVAELEFVWDQIRANDASPSASEELEPPPFPPLPAVGTESLRLLRPFSESDDADDEPEEDGLDALGEQALMADKTRRRQWQARMERAVVQLAAEVAALREVVGAQQGRGGKRGWGWVGWMVGVLVRHALFDALVLGCAVVWGQWRGEDWRWETIRGWVRKWWEGWRRRTKWRVRANG